MMPEHYPSVNPATGKFLHAPTHDLYSGVKTVNGKTPDPSGNVQLNLGGGPGGSASSFVEDPPGSGLYKQET